MIVISLTERREKGKGKTLNICIGCLATQEIAVLCTILLCCQYNNIVQYKTTCFTSSYSANSYTTPPLPPIAISRYKKYKAFKSQFSFLFIPL